MDAVAQVAFVGDVPANSEDAYFAADAAEAKEAYRKKPATRSATRFSSSFGRTCGQKMRVCQGTGKCRCSPSSTLPRSVLTNCVQSASSVKQCGCALGGACDSPSCDGGGCGVSASSLLVVTAWVAVATSGCASMGSVPAWVAVVPAWVELLQLRLRKRRRMRLT